jgi:hypothetical protein
MNLKEGRMKSNYKISLVSLVYLDKLLRILFRDLLFLKICKGNNLVSWFQYFKKKMELKVLILGLLTIWQIIRIKSRDLLKDQRRIWIIVIHHQKVARIPHSGLFRKILREKGSIVSKYDRIS